MSKFSTRYLDEEIATDSEIELKQNISEKNMANGYAGLDSSGLIPSELLPSIFNNQTIDGGSPASTYEFETIDGGTP